MTNYPAYPAPSVPRPAAAEIEGERDYPVYVYRASSLPLRARENSGEGHRLARNLTSATMLVYGMMAMSAVAEFCLLGTLQQWW